MGIYSEPLFRTCAYSLLLCFIGWFTPQLSVGAQDDSKGNGNQGKLEAAEIPTMAAVKVTMTAEANGGFKAFFPAFCAEKMETKAINRTLERKAFQRGGTGSGVIFYSCHRGGLCLNGVSILALRPEQCPAASCSTCSHLFLQQVYDHLRSLSASVTGSIRSILASDLYCAGSGPCAATLRLHVLFLGV